MAEKPSYTGMLNYYKLKPSDMTEKCSDAIIKVVAARMTEWKLDRLSLGSEKVESIGRECSTEEEKKLKYLKSWKDNLDYKATYSLLVERLLEAGNASLAGVVCTELWDSLPGKEHEHVGECGMMILWVCQIIEQLSICVGMCEKSCPMNVCNAVMQYHNYCHEFSYLPPQQMVNTPTRENYLNHFKPHMKSHPPLQIVTLQPFRILTQPADQSLGVPEVPSIRLGW